MLVECNHSLEYLLQKGAHINDFDIKRQSPLCHASLRSNPTCINTMLRQGADVNLSDINGDTPLHAGAEFAELETINALVAAPECDVNRMNNEGKTALDVGRSKRSCLGSFDKVIEYLENIISSPKTLLGARLNSMEQSCDMLKNENNQMNENQSKLFDELTQRVLHLEKQM